MHLTLREAFSIATLFLRSCMATSEVVPVPENGSSTTSPTFDDASIILTSTLSDVCCLWNLLLSFALIGSSPEKYPDVSSLMSSQMSVTYRPFFLPIL